MLSTQPQQYRDATFQELNVEFEPSRIRLRDIRTSQYFSIHTYPCGPAGTSETRTLESRALRTLGDLHNKVVASGCVARILIDCNTSSLWGPNAAVGVVSIIAYFLTCLGVRSRRI